MLILIQLKSINAMYRSCFHFPFRVLCLKTIWIC